MKFILFPAEELKPGEMRVVAVANVEVVIVRDHRGVFHALRNVCSHQGAHLSAGNLAPLIGGNDVGQYELSDDTEVLRCPWHGYEYALDTGRSLADPQKTRVRSYQVSIEDGRVAVER